MKYITRDTLSILCKRYDPCLLSYLNNILIFLGRESTLKHRKIHSKNYLYNLCVRLENKSSPSPPHPVPPLSNLPDQLTGCRQKEVHKILRCGVHEASLTSDVTGRRQRFREERSCRKKAKVRGRCVDKNYPQV